MNFFIYLKTDLGVKTLLTKEALFRSILMVYFFCDPVQFFNLEQTMCCYRTDQVVIVSVLDFFTALSRLHR